LFVQIIDNCSHYFCFLIIFNHKSFGDVSYVYFPSEYQGGHLSSIYRKVQLKPLKWIKVAKSNGEGEEERPVEALMVLKYGGVLTHAGRKQVKICNFKN
jgi:hypothetical protein